MKTFPTFLFSFLKYFFYNLFGNYKKKEIYKMRFSGLLNSYLLRKSFYRPKI